MINFIKGSMFKEQKWNEDMQNVLKDQVEFLKREIVVKNSLIESLLVELYKKNSTSNYEQDELNPLRAGTGYILRL